MTARVTARRRRPHHLGVRLPAPRRQVPRRHRGADRGARRPHASSRSARSRPRARSRSTASDERASAARKGGARHRRVARHRTRRSRSSSPELGASVAVTARTVEPRGDDLPGTIHETAEAIERAGATALAIGADLARREDRDRVVQEVLDTFGRVDILVNNAADTGDNVFRGFWETSPEQWAAQIDLNLNAMYALMKALRAHHPRQRRGPDREPRIDARDARGPDRLRWPHQRGRPARPRRIPPARSRSSRCRRSWRRSSRRTTSSC